MQAAVAVGDGEGAAVDLFGGGAFGFVAKLGKQGHHPAVAGEGGERISGVFGGALLLKDLPLELEDRPCLADALAERATVVEAEVAGPLAGEVFGLAGDGIEDFAGEDGALEEGHGGLVTKLDVNGVTASFYEVLHIHQPKNINAIVSCQVAILKNKIGIG